MSNILNDLSRMPASKAEYDNVYNRVQEESAKLRDKGKNAKNQYGDYDLWKQCCKEAEKIEKMFEQYDDNVASIYQSLPVR